MSRLPRPEADRHRARAHAHRCERSPGWHHRTALECSANLVRGRCVVPLRLRLRCRLLRNLRIHPRTTVDHRFGSLPSLPRGTPSLQLGLLCFVLFNVVYPVHVGRFGIIGVLAGIGATGLNGLRHATGPRLPWLRLDAAKLRPGRKVQSLSQALRSYCTPEVQPIRLAHVLDDGVSLHILYNILQILRGFLRRLRLRFFRGVLDIRLVVPPPRPRPRRLTISSLTLLA